MQRVGRTWSSSEGVVRIAVTDREVPMEGRALRNFGLFVLVLVVLKVFVGWNISIIGSVVITLILSVVIGAMNRR